MSSKPANFIYRKPNKESILVLALEFVKNDMKFLIYKDNVISINTGMTVSDLATQILQIENSEIQEGSWEQDI